MSSGLYRVTGNRAYRGHEPGSEFVGWLDPLAEQRAIARGAITLLERITPTLPDQVSLPQGWLDNETRET